jgi:hypothetical protein
MSPFFSLLWFCNYIMGINYIYIQFHIFIYPQMYLKFILCAPTCIVVLSSSFLLLCYDALFCRVLRDALMGVYSCLITLSNIL